MPTSQSKLSNQRQDANSQFDIQFSRAARYDEIDAALRCIYDAYHRQGLAPFSRLGLRITRHHLLPTTRVFTALRGGQVIGTLSLADDDDALGVPMRSAFGPQVDQLARTGDRLSEATCLALRDERRDGAVVVHQLMGLAAQSAQRRGASRILIAVHPRHASFYIRAAGFRPFGTETSYPSVGGRPALPLQLNLSTLHIDRPDAWRMYFGMSYSPSALSTELTAPNLLQRLSVLWRALRAEWDDEEEAEAAPASAAKRRLSA